MAGTGILYMPSVVCAKKRNNQKRMRDVYGGNESLRAAGRAYLPQFYSSESDEAYTARVQSAHMNNYISPAIDGYVGRIFSKPTTLGDDFTEIAQEWWEDIDLQGNNGDVFFQDVVHDGILDGLSWVLVDYPRGEAANLKEEKELGLRPYCRSYPDIDVIFVEADRRGRITEFRAIETITRSIEIGEPENGAFTQEEVQLVRRIFPGGYQIYEGDQIIESGEMSFPDEYGVPVIPYFAKKKKSNDFYVKPPLLDAAEKCIRLWKSQSEQDNCLQLARCPFLFAAGFTPPDEEKGIVLGPNISYWSDKPDASIRWVEHSGSALASGSEDITNLKKDIAAEILKPLQSDQERTKYEAQSDDDKAISPIKRMADNAHDMIENVLKYMAIWIGEADGGSITLNSNFEVVNGDSGVLSTLSTMRQNREISRSTYWKEMKRRGVLSDDFDPDTEQDTIEAEGETETESDIFSDAKRVKEEKAKKEKEGTGNQGKNEPAGNEE